METKRIFWLIDDDADEKMLFGLAVKRAERNIVFLPVETGEEAFALLNQKSTELPHVIFLDINMPRMSGLECLAKLKGDARTKNIPVIMYSTSEREADIRTAEELGAINFCVKPDDLPELQKMLMVIYDHFEDDLQSKLQSAALRCMRYKQKTDNRHGEFN